MKIKIYDIADHDIIERYYGAESTEKPMVDIGERFGKLVFDDKMGHPPDVMDVLALPDEHGDLQEFVVMSRMYYPASNSMEIVIHERHYDEEAALS